MHCVVDADPFPQATGTAKDATVTAEMRSVLGRTRDDPRRRRGDLRPAPPPRATAVPTRDGTFAQRLAAWAAQQAPGRVVFTVADANSPSMADARLDTSRTFGTNLLVVALDEAAAVAACAAGCAVVRFGGGKGRSDLRGQVHAAPPALAERDATFREMDVWHLRDPAAGTKEADVVFSVHQDNPGNINAGWIHARGGGTWTARSSRTS